MISPDVGTGASLFAAAMYSGRLRSLVVGSGGAAFPLQLGGVVKDWVEAPDLDGYRTADPRQIVAGRSYPTELPILRDLLPRIQTPVQIIAGARDLAVPSVNAEFLHERLPRSKLDILDSGHYPWEDAADDYAALVTNWWSGDYATTASQATR